MLAIDESPASQAAAMEVSRRQWPSDTTVRVLHTVGRFVPPVQELWNDAGGNLDQARQEIRDRFQTLVEETAKLLAEGFGALLVLGNHPVTWAFGIGATFATIMSRMFYHGKPAKIERKK